MEAIKREIMVGTLNIIRSKIEKHRKSNVKC